MICSKCNIEKNPTDFKVYKSGTIGTACLDCVKILNAKHQRDWYWREKKKKIKKIKLKSKQKRYVENLTDSYVKKYLKLRGFVDEISQDLIEIQRQSLLLKRELR